jgi:hypothetical protein
MSSCLRSGCQIQVQRIAMFAGQYSDISHRKRICRDVILGLSWEMDLYGGDPLPGEVEWMVLVF